MRRQGRYASVGWLGRGGRLRVPGWALAALLSGLVMGLEARPVLAATQNPIEALEQARVVVVGTFDSVTPVGYGAYVGELRVDENLSEAPLERVSYEVAWEEPGLSVPARYARGHRVLVGLGPLPTASIWKERIPELERRNQVLWIDGKGEAAIPRPSAAAAHLMHHYLALSPSARHGEAGLLRLAQMTSRTEVELAQPALARLTGLLAQDDAALPGQAALELVVALQRDNEPGLVQDLLGWVAESRPTELAAPLAAARARDKAASRSRGLEAAHAAIVGHLDSDREVTLLDSDDPTERELACGYLRGDEARRRLPGLILSDPAPSVRVKALQRWADLEGEGAIPEAVRALDDPSVKVRRAAAEVLAEMGQPAIDELHRVTRRDASDGARMAVASLSMMGQPAQEALQDVSIRHEDEGMRTLARIALGLPIGHID